MNPPHPRASIDELASAYCDGTLDDASCQWLQHLVKTNHAARRRFILYMQMHVACEQEVAIAPGCELPAKSDELVQRTACRSTNANELVQRTACRSTNAREHVQRTACRSTNARELVQRTACRSTNAGEHAHPRARLWRRAVDFVIRPTPFSMSVAALFLGVLVAVLSLVAPPFNLVQGPELPPSDLVKTVAQVTSLHGVEWSNEQDSVHNGAFLVRGKRLSLDSGLAEITYSSGARVIIEGPVAFRVLDRNSAALEHGRAVARVNQSSQGFTIEAGRIQAVDLGTEFGLIMKQNGAGEAVVYEGKIKLVAEKENASRILHAGEYLRFHSDGRFDGQDARELGQAHKQLARVMPENLDQDASYEDMIRALRPAVWYRMDGAGHTLVDSSGNACHGKIISSGVARAGKGDGNSLALRGSGFGDYAVVANYPQAQRNRLTVMAWVYADGKTSWGSIAKNWGDSRTGQFHFGLSLDAANLSIFVQPKTAGSPVFAIDPEPFPLRQWQHTAFVVDGSQLLLYRNAELVARQACNGIEHDVTLPALGIGCKLNDAGKAPATSSGFWHGQLDELVIINAAASRSLLRRLMDASRPDGDRPQVDKPK